MMRMQPEGEGLSGQVACGGAARRVDAHALGEFRHRATVPQEEPGVPVPMCASAVHEAEERRLDERRRTLRRRVVAVLVVAAAVLALACWEYLPGVLAWLADPQAVRAFVAEHGIASRLVMLGINMAQIFLAFLPGEPVELASGYAFGFVEGTVLCLIASGVATSAIYWATRRWGWCLVGLFFDRSLLQRFSWLNNARRLDFLTYFAGLIKMRFAPVVLIATFGRIPSIVTSTAAASAVGSGNWLVAAAVVVASALLIALGGLAYRRVCARAK